MPPDYDISLFHIQSATNVLEWINPLIHSIIYVVVDEYLLLSSYYMSIKKRNCKFKKAQSKKNGYLKDATWVLFKLRKLSNNRSWQ